MIFYLKLVRFYFCLTLYPASRVDVLEWKLINDVEKMGEIVFVVKESPEVGFEAHAVGHSIFTEEDDIKALKQNVKEAVHCHFDKDVPTLIKLQFVKEEIIEA